VNLFTKMVLVATVIAAPLASFAQSSQSVSRTQLHAELAQLEKAGYDPHDWIHYPENLQAAEAKVAAQSSKSQAGISGYGGTTETKGTSRSGN
jgi:hypothetical protein